MASYLSLLTGSFSMGAAENPTVAMVEAAYHHHGLDARYINCEVAPEALGDAVRGARAMGWAGFNCSIPHKVAVIEHLDGLADSAAAIGAVNCVVRRDGRYVGRTPTVRASWKRCALSSIRPGSRSSSSARAARRARSPSRRRWPAPPRSRSSTATPSAAPSSSRCCATERRRRPSSWNGTAPSPCASSATRRRAACTVLDGLGMLVNQGVIGIRHWTGVDPDPAVMRATLEGL